MFVVISDGEPVSEFESKELALLEVRDLIYAGFVNTYMYEDVCSDINSMAFA